MGFVGVTQLSAGRRLFDWLRCLRHDPNHARLIHESGSLLEPLLKIHTHYRELPAIILILIAFNLIKINLFELPSYNYPFSNVFLWPNLP